MPSPYHHSPNHITQPVIVQIVPHLNKGGVERGTVEIAQAIVKRGWKAVVISNGGQLEGQLKRIGAEFYHLPVHSKNPLFWLSVRSKLRHLLLSLGADLVHVRSRVPAWIALPVARGLGLPAIATIHSKFLPKNLFKQFYNAKMLSADKVIAISHYVKSVITQHYKNAPDAAEISVVHRGVDLSVFDPAKVSQQRIIREAERLGLPDEGVHVMLPARPTRWKGHEILIQAVAALERQDVTLLLLGAGDGNDRFIARLKALALSAGLDGRLRIATSTNDMPAALMLADVVAMPSIIPEPFGRVAIEAQAMGRPVVAFNHGGAAESIIDNQTGWLAVPGDADSLKQVLQKALSLSQRQRSLLARRTREHVQTAFSRDQMCEKTLEIYANFLQK